MRLNSRSNISPSAPVFFGVALLLNHPHKDWLPDWMGGIPVLGVGPILAVRGPLKSVEVQRRSPRRSHHQVLRQPKLLSSQWQPARPGVCAWDN